MQYAGASHTLSVYSPATGCPVLARAMGLDTCYAMSGTDVGHRRRSPSWGISSHSRMSQNRTTASRYTPTSNIRNHNFSTIWTTNAVSLRIGLRSCYEMPGTNRAYGAASAHKDDLRKEWLEAVVNVHRAEEVTPPPNGRLFRG
eukprot:3936157-Rhodomonas_salina.5